MQMRGILVVALLCTVAACASADWCDVVEREHIAYHAAATLASDGLIPGFAARDFAGDFLYTRGDFARITAALMKADLMTSILRYERNKHLVAILAHEFAPELESMGLGGEGFEPSDTCMLGLARGWAWDDTENDPDEHADAYGRLGLSWTVGPATRVYVSGGDERDYFRAGNEDYPILDQAYADFRRWGLDWRVGRSQHNWGPAFTGSGLLSDSAPPLDHVGFGVDVRLPFFGWHRVTQFMTTFREQGERRWLMGRTWEHRVSDRWRYTFGETVKMSVTPDIPLLVLPFYGYQKLTNFATDDEFNVLSSFGATYRAGERWSVYGQFTVDDVTSPFRFGHGAAERPKKMCYTAGVHYADLFGPSGLDVVVEAVRTDRGTYSHRNPDVAYTYEGYVLGHPYGDDTKALYVRVGKRLGRKLSCVLEGDLRRQITGYDTGPGDLDRYAVAVSYDLAPWVSATVRVSPYKTTSAAGEASDGTRYYLELVAGF
jgi:hypothetical protein